ncbi:GyrI-like domain-containing protein [Paractinoplanes brasiliensis]|uniref:Effector-binding domain-containing protein n=1 Tax=Paractinoplanes brasiliensis TaxID=52695 RepID=A0A4R6JYP6_9ACTN|nr:GyrI-like domain-containing protein [Actinoplanes brasiliensis]TDO41960.1 hypothetical protein C8E87_5721 [Actinoplanes brasiliensis]GID29759.1 hypothetical protein Abr02nite_47420 [Actinoplanes brasiliensis]
MANLDLADPLRETALRDAEVVTCSRARIAGFQAVVRVPELRHWTQNVLPDAAAALRRRGARPVGPPIVVLRPRSDGAIEVTAGYQIDSASPADGLGCEMLPAGPAARAVHAGPHESLLSAYDRVLERLTVRLRGTVPVMWEEYLVGPELTDSPAAWRTAVICPLNDVAA